MKLSSDLRAQGGSFGLDGEAKGNTSTQSFVQTLLHLGYL